MLNLVNTTAQRLVQLELLNFFGDLVWIREGKRGQRVILGRIGVLGGGLDRDGFGSGWRWTQNCVRVGGNGKYGVESREECKCSCGIPHSTLAGRGYENFT